MYLQNVVMDSRNPRALGRFWERLLGTTTLTETPDAFETRLSGPDGPILDLCFQAVPSPVTPGARLHLDIAGGGQQADVVERAVTLGARHLDIGQHDVPWVVLADPEGNAFCVMEARPEFERCGVIAGIPVDSSDPARDVEFWTQLSGWVVEAATVPAMRHRSGLGPLIELCPGPVRRGTDKNRLHCDIRLESGDDPHDAASRVLDLGGHELHPDGGALPWRVFADPQETSSACFRVGEGCDEMRRSVEDAG